MLLLLAHKKAPNVVDVKVAITQFMQVNALELKVPMRLIARVLVPPAR